MRRSYPYPVKRVIDDNKSDPASDEGDRQSFGRNADHEGNWFSLGVISEQDYP